MRHVALLVSILCSIVAKGQCGFDGTHQYRIHTDSIYASATRQFNDAWIASQSTGATAKIIMSPPDTIFEIPVMIHVLHRGEALGTVYNPSDTQLISWLKYTSAVFGASWPGYATPATGGVNTHIRFVLAKNDGHCNPLPTAIFRVNASSVPGYASNGVHYSGSVTGQGANEGALRALSPAKRECLNIWIVHRFDTSSVAGYAYYNDNLAFVACSFARAGNTLLPHEIGHSFGLYHTFEGDNGGTTCPPTTNCASTGDLICDTEPDKQYPVCTATINPCTGLAYGNIKYNIMNYVRCTPGQDRFTPGQSRAMRFSIYNYLWSAGSVAGDSVKPLPPLKAATCGVSHPVPFDSSSALSGPTLVSFNDIHCRSGVCRDDGTYIDNTCQYRTTVKGGFTYPLAVQTAGMIQNVRAYIDYNNDGTFQLPGEQIMSVNRAGSKAVAMVAIPNSGVVTGKPLRLRVVCDEFRDTLINPCAVLQYGQAEDYAVTITSSAGIAEPSAFPYNVYPNPAGNTIHLSSDKPINGRLVLYNAIGTCVFTMMLEAKTNYTIQTANYPPGLYTLLLKDSSGVTRTTRICLMH
jgi:hypothetical protein